MGFNSAFKGLNWGAEVSARESTMVELHLKWSSVRRTHGFLKINLSMSAVTAVHRKAGFYTKYESLNKSAVRVFCQTSKNIFLFFSTS